MNNNGQYYLHDIAQAVVYFGLGFFGFSGFFFFFNVCYKKNVSLAFKQL